MRVVFGCLSWLGVSALCGCGRMESLDVPFLLTTSDPSDTADPGQWSGHRGALLQGVSREVGLPERFDRDTNLRWMTALPGHGNSSPTVHGDRIFLTAELPGAAPQLTVLCVDRLSGRVLWHRDVGPPRGRTHRKNGYATATVATDGTRVYATFGPLGIFCLDYDGELIWHQPLEHLDHEWGHASSPVVVGDTVVQLADGRHGSYLMAFNCYSGELRWAAERTSSGSWTTPVLVKAEMAGRTRWELVVNGTGSTNGSQGFVIAYDPGTGDELWRVQGTTDIPCPTAIVGDALVISTSGGNGPGPIIAIRPGGTGDVTASHVVWKLPWGGPYVPTGIIDAGRLYLISDGGILRSLDAQSGEVLWEKRLQHSFSASLVAGDRKLYVLSEQGDLHVFATGQQGRLLAVNRLGERCLATPAIAQGEVFVRGEEHLFCFANRAHQSPSLSSADDDDTTVVSTTTPLDATPPSGSQ